jgi:hypothetical protein
MLRKAYRDEKLSLEGDYFRLINDEHFAAWLAPLAEKTWIVHSEVANRRGSSGTLVDAEKTVRYLARYAGGVALHNTRLQAIDEKTVTFSYKDYRDKGRRKVMTMDGVEFLRRFLTHVLPAGMLHIRNYGFLSPNKRTEKLRLIRAQLGIPEPSQDSTNDDATPLDKPPRRKCRKCEQGEMIPGPEIPRPTLWEIMTAPFWWLVAAIAPPEPESEAEPEAEPIEEQRSLPLDLEAVENKWMHWDWEYG